MLEDKATPSRRSRTLMVTVGGVSVAVLAQAALIVCRIVGYEPPVDEGDLVLVFSALILVAQHFQRQATARTEAAAKSAAGDVVPAGGGTMGEIRRS